MVPLLLDTVAAAPGIAGLLAVSVLVGLCLCLVGTHVARRWQEPGVTSFVIFLFAFGGTTALASGILLVAADVDTTAQLWLPLSVGTWAISVPPWLVFTLTYTGTYTQLGPRGVGLIASPLVGVPLLFAESLGFSNPNIVMLRFLSLVSLLGAMTIGCYLIVRTAHQYGHLSTTQGAIIASVPVIVLLESNFSGTVARSFGLTAGLGFHTVGITLGAVVLMIGVYRYDKFQSAPAVGTIGERTIVRETDELMFVIDDDERIIKLNQTAADALGVSRSAVLGEPLARVLDEEFSRLQGRDVVQLTTESGERRFDPVWSDLTDQHGRSIGYTLALHDITELELREQRLEVLNRVLRHNLRNQVEVIQADRLTELGRSARSIDQVVSRPLENTAVDVGALVEEVAEEAVSGTDVTLTTRIDGGTLDTDEEALTAAVESAVESAVCRATDAVDIALEPAAEGYRLTVVDDGAGIPDAELNAVTAGTETALQHATGLELWRLKWAVTKLNGDLCFENDDGTTIELSLPDDPSETSGVPV